MLCKPDVVIKNEQQVDFNLIPQSPYIENHFSDDQKIEIISNHFEKILETLGLDLTDDSIMETPYRYAKMLVKELFSGLKKENFPKITTQENKFQYTEMLVEANIEIKSVCEHHFLPILGYCHIAYFPGNKVVGLSKLNRIAQYFARRPQVQERMTKQIKECLCQVLETESVAVVVDGLHMCVRMRGIQDAAGLTRTSDFGGLFLSHDVRHHFLSTIPGLKDLKI
ncbi:MAG: GTP cyclohydrolase I FolE [Parachlamydiaceae bacterium]